MRKLHFKVLIADYETEEIIEYETIRNFITRVGNVGINKKQTNHNFKHKRSKKRYRAIEEKRIKNKIWILKTLARRTRELYIELQRLGIEDGDEIGEKRK